MSLQADERHPRSRHRDSGDPAPRSSVALGTRSRARTVSARYTVTAQVRQDERVVAVDVISMVLVATRYNRQGLGRRLMTHALAEAGDAVVLLNATDLGQP